MSDIDTNLLRNTIASVQKPGWLMEHAAPGSVAKLLADLSAPLLDEVERLSSELSSWREAAAEWERAAEEWEQAAKEAWSQAEHFPTVAGAMAGMAKDIQRIAVAAGWPEGVPVEEPGELVETVAGLRREAAERDRTTELASASEKTARGQ